MAGAGSEALTQAIQAAGGLGSLPCAAISPAQIEEKLQTLTSKENSAPFNLNFFTHHEKACDPNAQAQWLHTFTDDYKRWNLNLDKATAAAARSPFNHDTCKLVERYAPKVVSFHFGLPKHDLLQRVKEDFEELATVEFEPKTDGRFMTMVLAPR